jgi:hypothetical protein
MPRITVNPAISERTVAADGLFDPPRHLSFSQITKLSSRYERSCPRQWAYNKRFGIPGGFGNGMILGRALDEAVQSFFGRRQFADNAEVAAAAALPVIAETIMSGEWTDQKRPREDYVEMMERAFAAFVDAYRDLRPASIQRDHVYEVAVPGGRRRMVGYSDWIDADGTINDLKYSGSARWNADGEWYPEYVAQVRDQICTYYMGRVYAEHAGVLDATAPVIPHGRVVVVHAAINRKDPVVKSLDFEFTDELVSEIADAVREADAIASSDYQPPRPGPACQWCAYVARCQSDLAATVTSTTALAELAS